jgi:hypothetical protein
MVSKFENRATDPSLMPTLMNAIWNNPVGLGGDRCQCYLEDGF